jgi:hypothetical protein
VSVASLAQILAPLDSIAHSHAAWKYGASASLEEVIEAVRSLPPNDGAWDDLAREITRHGPGMASTIARALLADPLAPDAAILGDFLMQTLEHDEGPRDFVVATPASVSAPEHGSRVDGVVQRSAGC